MTRVVPFGTFREQIWMMRTNADHAAQRYGGGRGKRIQHHRGGLAGGDHIHCGCLLQRRNDVRIVERAPYQPAGIDAVDGSANDGREVLAEPAVKRCQLRGVS
jgi:hypothetical protein